MPEALFVDPRGQDIRSVSPPPPGRALSDNIASVTDSLVRAAGKCHKSTAPAPPSSSPLEERRAVATVTGSPSASRNFTIRRATATPRSSVSHATWRVSTPGKSCGPHSPRRSAITFALDRWHRPARRAGLRRAIPCHRNLQVHLSCSFRHDDPGLATEFHPELHCEVLWGGCDELVLHRPQHWLQLLQRRRQ